MASVSPENDWSGEHGPEERDGCLVVAADQLVDLLGDEYTRRVLETIADEPMGGREIAETTSISRPTVYRRLNRLEEAGLVETRMTLCSDGHHHQQYRAVLETASFQLDDGGLTASVRTEDASRGSRNGLHGPVDSEAVGD